MGYLPGLSTSIDPAAIVAMVSRFEEKNADIEKSNVFWEDE